MNKATSDQLIFTAAAVAKAAGVEQHVLRTFEPEGFGSPGHWYMQGNDVIYTERGLEELVQGLNNLGEIRKAAAVYALLATERQKVATPSRALVEPGPKSSVTEHAWQRRADCV